MFWDSFHSPKVRVQRVNIRVLLLVSERLKTWDLNKLEKLKKILGKLVLKEKCRFNQPN